MLSQPDDDDASRVTRQKVKTATWAKKECDSSEPVASWPVGFALTASSSTMANGFLSNGEALMGHERAIAKSGHKPGSCWH